MLTEAGRSLVASPVGFETERRATVVARGYPVSTPDACVRTSVDPCVPFVKVF